MLYEVITPFMRRAKPFLLATTLLLPLTAQAESSAADLAGLFDGAPSRPDESAPVRNNFV